jgi:hypothetical protein
MRTKLLESEKKFNGYCQGVFKSVIFKSKYNQNRQVPKSDFFKRLYKRIKENSIEIN